MDSSGVLLLKNAFCGAIPKYPLCRYQRKLRVSGLR